MSEQPTKQKRRERPSFIWPLVLITIGILILLSNVGILEGDIWDSILQFWPVILIAIGLDSLFRRNEIAGPVFMIGLGIVFQFSNLGVIGWGTWDVLWRLWPVLLVAVGLEIIIGRRSLLISLVSVLLILAILSGVVWFLGPGPISAANLIGDQVNQTLEDIQQAEIVISPAVGELNVGANQDPATLISGEITTGKNQQVYSNYEVVGSTGIYEVTSSFTVYPLSSVGWDWDLSLTKALPLEVALNLGAGDLNADLSDLELTHLDIQQGVGEVNVTLPDSNSYSVNLSQAVGSMVVDLPETVGFQIEVSKAISSLSIPADFEQKGDYYYSSNFDGAVNKIELQINQAIGSILLRYK